jgi:hypothetical protein
VPKACPPFSHQLPGNLFKSLEVVERDVKSDAHDRLTKVCYVGQSGRTNEETVEYLVQSRWATPGACDGPAAHLDSEEEHPCRLTRSRFRQRDFNRAARLALGAMAVAPNPANVNSRPNSCV